MAKYTPPKDRFNSEFFMCFEKVREVSETRYGLDITVDNERIKLDFVHADVLRIKISRGGTFDADPTFAVVHDEFERVPVTVTREPSQVSAVTNAMKVIVGLEPFTLDIHRTDGSPILESHNNCPYGILNDRWAVVRAKTPGDAFLGFGQRTGKLNHNGRYLQMWTVDPSIRSVDTDFDPYYMAIPFYYHIPRGGTAAAGFFIDNGYRIHCDLSHSDKYFIVGDGGQLTEYIFAGPSVRDILRRYAGLTGHMPAPPRWALGHHQCKWHPYVESDIRELAATYREKKLPCDVIWLDIDYMEDFRIFSWDHEKYPDPAGLIADLRRDGFKSVAIIDPGVKMEPGYEVYDEGMDQNLFCRTRTGNVFVGKVWPGHTVFPDFVKEETRRWWTNHITRFMRTGLDGIWIDMNEPAFKMADERHMRFDHDGADHDHDRYHNQYGFLMARATHAGVRKAMPAKRPFVLSRSGFAGIQRYAANWMGDNASRWSHLAMSIPMSCNTALSGQPFVGSDVGGFAENVTPELLVRWYQYAVFQPFFRNHAIRECEFQYPWSFGEQYERIIREALERRYALLPYLYTCFMTAHATGDPIQRPLVYDFQEDPTVRDISDQFMCGDNLMIAPVLHEGAQNRKVYLPHGRWYRFDEPGIKDGGQFIAVDTPLEYLPVFVRAGSIIPTVPPSLSTSEYAPGEITLNIYLPRANGQWTSTLYEDDGEGFEYTRGAFLRSTFILTRNGSDVSLSCTVEGEGFPSFRRTAFRIRTIGAEITEQVVANSGESGTWTIK